MIKTIIFDFGDVFINLDKPATEKEFKTLGDIEWSEEIEEVNKQYETGSIPTSEFIKYYRLILPKSTEEQIINAWNAILKDFPVERLHFLQNLAAQENYKLILLSNTNDLHISWIKGNISFYKDFKKCFDSFYLSHQIHLRKPNSDIFEFVLKENNLKPKETLFIDDTAANTATAKEMGIHTWNNNPATQDVVDLFTIKSELF